MLYWYQCSKKIHKIIVRKKNPSDYSIHENLKKLGFWYGFEIQNLNSETLELLSPTEPNRIKHGFKGSELFQYFDVFRVLFDRTELCFKTFEWFYSIWCIWMIFSSISIEILKKFDSVRSNKFELIQLNSIRFYSVRFGSIQFDSVWFDIPGKF